MATKKELETEVLRILKARWQRRDGKDIPETEDIQLNNDSVDLEGTVLYADVTDSTGLVDHYKDWFAAEIYKSYLFSACKIIRDNGGRSIGRIKSPIARRIPIGFRSGIFWRQLILWFRDVWILRVWHIYPTKCIPRTIYHLPESFPKFSGELRRRIAAHVQ